MTFLYKSKETEESWTTNKKTAFYQKHLSNWEYFIFSIQKRFVLDNNNNTELHTSF